MIGSQQQTAFEAFTDRDIQAKSRCSTTCSAFTQWIEEGIYTDPPVLRLGHKILIKHQIAEEHGRESQSFLGGEGH